MLLKGRLSERKNRRHHGKNIKATAGNNAGGRSSSAVTSQRSTVTSSNRAHSASRRISHQQRQQQQPPQAQQQQQQQQQPSRISLASLRNPDENGSRAGSAQDVCDNSNDSGLGFEDRQQHLSNANVSTGPVVNSGGTVPSILSDDFKHS